MYILKEIQIKAKHPILNSASLFHRDYEILKMLCDFKLGKNLIFKTYFCRFQMLHIFQTTASDES